MHWTRVALALALAVYLGAFAAVMLAVRRRSGQSARGHHGGHPWAAALNALATLLLLLTALAYPIDARSVDWFGRIRFLDVPLARAIGLLALALSGLLLIWGEISLGLSFRVALPESRQALVTRGCYRFTRNPLALSVDLLALGVLLLAPSRLALGSLLLNVLAYESKIRIEESYLRQAHGAAYEAYCARVGRYLPRLRRPAGGKEVDRP